MSLRKLERVALLLGALLLVGGCAPLSAPPATASPSPRGGTVVVAWQEPATLHPFYSTGTLTNAMVYSVAVEGLTKTQPDGSLAPVLATEVPTLANSRVQLGGSGMSVRWSLRDAKWSDGEPLTSADVRFTWQSVMRDPLVASREGYDLIEAVDTPDDRTVVVRYRALDPAYATRFDALLPRHLLDGVDASKTDYVRRPLGAGPFVITEFAAGDHVTAERNARYRDPSRPLLDKIIFRFVSSVDAAKAQLRAGEVQVSASLSEADVLELEKDAEIKVETAPSPAVETLAFNLAKPGDPTKPHPVLGDLPLRHALLLATPKQQIVERLLGGRSRPGTSEIPIGWASPAGLSQEGYEPARAKQLLDDAGWKAGADGIRSRDGVRATLTVTSTTGNKLREQVEQVLVDEWKAIGVELKIRNVPNATLTGSFASGGVRKRGDFDIVLAMTGLGFGATDPHSYLSQRRRCGAIPRAENNGAGANYERFCDQRVDKLLERAGATLDQDERARLYAEALRAIDASVADIYLFDRGRFDAHRSNLSGVVSNGWDVLTWNSASWSATR